MSSKKIVSINTILKHRRLTSNIEHIAEHTLIANVKLIYENALQSNTLNGFKKNFQELINAMSENCSLTNQYYSLPLFALARAKADTSPFREEAVDSYIQNILPMLATEALQELRESDDFNHLFTDDQKDKWSETITDNLISDRILNNHNGISERFNIEDIIVKSSRLGMASVAEQTKSFIDTYNNIRPYQKMNICLEEIYYVLGKNSVKYDKSELVRNVTEAFLLSDYEEKKENYKKVLESSYCFNEEDVANAEELFDTESSSQPGTIKYFIDEYVKLGTEPLYDLCVKIGGCSLNDIKINLPIALDFLWNVVNSRNINYQELQEAVQGLFITLANKVNDDVNFMCLDDVKQLDNMIDTYFDENRTKASNMFYNQDTDRYLAYERAVSLAKEQFVKDCSYLYSRNNIDNMISVNSESAKVVSLNEFKKFRFTNLVRAAINLEKYVKAKAHSVFHKKGKPHKFLKQAKNILFDENAEVYIQSDNKVDICVGQYYYDEAYEIEAKELFDEICKEFNATISNTPEMRAYYIFNPGIAEVHIKENTIISLTNEERAYVNSLRDPVLEVYSGLFNDIADTLDRTVNNENLKSDNIFGEEEVSLEQFELFIEALQYVNIDKDVIKSIKTQYDVNRYMCSIQEGSSINYKADKIKVSNIMENFKLNEDVIPLDVQIEAVNIMQDILEAGIKKPDIQKAEIKKADAGNKEPKHDQITTKHIDSDEPEAKKDDKDDGEKKEGKGFNFNKAINNIKLGLHGLKAKMGDMSQKEKEVSKNLDASAEHFIKSIHDGLVSDRREAIIKGSVIPSFSRCIKNAIALIGLGGASMLLVGNLLPAVIVALGGFALSKKLTQRERLLLLDEIETELDVVDKEIQLADSKNQMAKYRKLLAYKKDLQRQYQRIKYNVRIGKDMLPNSATGVYKSND